MITWTRPQKATIVVTLIYVFTYLSVMVLRPGSKQFSYAFLSIFQALPAVFGGIAGLVHYIKLQDDNRSQRIGWLLVALTCLFFATGHITWTYLKCVHNRSVLLCSLADLFWLMAFLLLLAGGILLFGTMRITECSRRVFDSVIVASSIGVLSWFFVVQKLWQQSDVPVLDKCINSAYPLVDIALLFGVITVLLDRKYSPSLRCSLHLLAAGMFAITFYDMAFVCMSLEGTYQIGNWIDTTISLGWLLIGYSFLARMRRANGQYPEDDQLLSSESDVSRVRWMVFPYVAVTVACVIICVRNYTRDGRIDNSTFTAVAFLMLLVMIRQILALAENRSLTLRLRSLNENLETLVAERTAEVMALVDERNRFFRNVSHEVRTPLTSIIGFAELLIDDEDEPLTPQQKVQFRKVVANAYKLLNMVNDLLDISKIEAGRMEVTYNDVDLNALVSQVVENMLPIAQEKALEFRMDLPVDMPLLKTDEKKLNHILVNLISNAIKYTVEGTITIRAFQYGESVSISVEDTGMGIPEHEISRIFEEFYRIPGRSGQVGTGLGLTIVSKMTGLLGGRVNVQSKEGEGSTFTVTLPLVPVKSGETTRTIDTVRAV